MLCLWAVCETYLDSFSQLQTTKIDALNVFARNPDHLVQSGVIEPQLVIIH